MRERGDDRSTSSSIGLLETIIIIKYK